MGQAPRLSFFSDDHRDDLQIDEFWTLFSRSNLLLDPWRTPVSNRLILIAACVLSLGITIAIFWSPINTAIAQINGSIFGDEPDLPNFAKFKIDKEDFMTRRAN